ncbi:winged helix-turn-helix transcriptional regulator [Nocardia arthritidis]|uniref:Transcriptional regulator n=1 Tax=Nocardia arthritidis TaxID=228602 RepID=A0A6G9Y666_9NOCA|nr:winged helix-turn-helix transcriptional regulator [Nocardia arthritidis]QIS08735.1 transcriptional regulator [Nocardia arthritidis]
MPQGIEYCPVSMGAEAIGDRWTLLLVRELLLGSRRFNDIHRGLPGISRTLLSGRLRRLCAGGLIARELDAEGRPEYRLTPAGAALEPLVWQLGDWARRWCFGEPQREQFDTALALWRLRQYVRRDRLPARRVIVEFIIRDAVDELAWLVLAPEETSACHRHPGYDTDIWVTIEPAELHRLVAGASTIDAAIHSGKCCVAGDPELVAEFPRWFAWRTVTAAASERKAR